jgi:organic radical activating enzyme
MTDSPIVFTQNVDRIIRAKDYDLLKKSGELLVTSIFRTLQGEAPFSGWPAIFLRMSGCNFGDKNPQGACRWCDTAFHFDQGKIYNPEILRQEIYAMAKEGDILVITGGEPTLQKNLVPFIKEILESGIIDQVQIETNGTQAAWFKEAENYDMPFAHNTEDQGLFIVMSPKGLYKAGSIPKPSDLALSYTGALKFVVEAEPNSPHHKVPAWVNEIDYRGPIYVSPMAVYKKAYQGEVSSIWDRDLIDHEKTSQNYAYAAQLAIDNGYRLSTQTHLFTAIP